MVFDSLIDDAVELWDGAFAVVLAVVLGCLVLYFVRSHHDLDGDLADESQDIKQAVNHVLMPRYLAHQSNISRLKKQHRAGEISRVEHRQAVVASANEFDVRYAVAVRAATALAEALPPEAEVIPLAELRRLTSVGDEELAMVEELQVEMHELSTRRTGISQSAT